MECAIVDSQGTLVAIVGVEEGVRMNWCGSNDHRILLAESFGIDDTKSYADYHWDGNSFIYTEPPEEVSIDDLVAAKVEEALAALAQGQE